MKRILIILAVLVTGLAIALAVRIKKFDAYKHAPAGGSGTIEGVELDVSPRISARITAVHVKEGEEVKAGQVLVELDCAEHEALLAETKARIAAAQTSIAAAEASVLAASGNTSAAHHSAQAAAAQSKALDADRENVSKEAQRLSTLYDSGAVSNSAFDQMDTRVVAMSRQLDAMKASEQAARARVTAAYGSQKAATAQIDSARANVQVAEASMRRAEIAVRECRLVAPRGGVVLSRNYEPGELALPGARLLTLVDLGEMRSTFYLPNAELGAAVPGRKVAVRADAWPGESFEGTILHVAAKAEFTPRNVQTREDRDRLVYAVEVTVPNPDRKLRPGMPIDVVSEGTGR